MSELLSCPFCGSHDVEVQGKPAILDALDSVCCNECSADAPYPVWNTRAQLPSQGGEAVEVAGWRRLDRPYELTAYPSVCAMWHGVGYPVQALYTHPADQVAQPDAELVRQCIAQELATWEGDFKGPVHTAMRCLQVRIDAKMASREVKP